MEALDPNIQGIFFFMTSCGFAFFTKNFLWETSNTMEYLWNTYKHILYLSKSVFGD